MFRAKAKKALALLLAVLVLAGAVPTVIFSLAEDAGETAVHTDLFAPNVFTYAENGSVDTATLAEDWKANIVASENITTGISAGWFGTDGHSCSQHSNMANGMMLSNKDQTGYAIFELTAPEGKMLKSLSLTINARFCNNVAATFAVGKSVDGLFMDVYTPTGDTSGKDTVVDVTDKVAEWGTVYVKVSYNKTASAGWAAVWSIDADAVYVDGVVTPTVDVHTDLFVPNTITTEEGSTNVASTALSDAWDDYLVEQKDVKMGTSRGWWGTAANWANANDVDAQAMMGSANNGYAIFKITAPADGTLSNLALTVNARYCADHYVKVAVSDAQDGAYTEVYAATGDISGNDIFVDVSEQVAGATDVYVKATFTAGNDWSSLWSIVADATYEMPPVEYVDEHTDLFVPNTITTEEGSTNVASTALSDAWDDYLVEQKDVKMGTSRGWWGTAANWANANNVDAQAMMGSANNGYAIFKITAPAGGTVTDLVLTINARYCADHYVKVAVSDAQDGAYTEVYAATGDISGNDTVVDVSEQVAGASDVYVKATFTAGNDWSSLWSIVADATYEVPATVVVDEHTDLFVPNAITTEEGSTNVASTALSDAWDDYLVEQKDVKMGTSRGWWGTAANWANANNVDAQAMMGSANNGYAIFKITAPAGGTVTDLVLTINARYCADHYVKVAVSDAQDGAYTEVYAATGDISGNDTVVDVSEQVAGASDVYVKATFTAGNDWSSLWSIVADASYEVSAVSSKPITTTEDIDLFVPNAITTVEGGTDVASTSLSDAWDDYIVDKSNVKMGTSNGWWGTTDNWCNKNNVRAQAMFNEDGGAVGYAIFKITAPEGGKLIKLFLTVNARSCMGATPTIAISDTQDGTYTDVYKLVDDNDAGNGNDVVVNVTEYVADAADVYVKASFPTAGAADWNSLYSITAKATYEVPAVEEPEESEEESSEPEVSEEESSEPEVSEEESSEPEVSEEESSEPEVSEEESSEPEVIVPEYPDSGLVELFNPNEFTLNVDGKIASAVLLENWEGSYLVASENVKSGTAAGWMGTNGIASTSQHSVIAYGMLNENKDASGYAVFKLAAPDGQTVKTLSLVINGRFCMNVGATISVSDKADGGFIEYYKPDGDTSGKDAVVDLSEDFAGTGDVYVRVDFPKTQGSDWGILWRIAADVEYQEDTTPTISKDTDLFVPNVIVSLGDDHKAETSLNEDWDLYLVESNNVKMGTSNGWSGTADTTVNPNYTNAQAMFNQDKGSAAYAIFKLEAPDGHKLRKLVLTVNSRFCMNTASTVSVGTNLGGEFTDVYTPNGDTSGKNTVVDVSEYTKNKGDIYVKVSFPNTGASDWTSLWALYATAVYVEGEPEEDAAVADRLAMIDYSKDDWATVYPYESIDGLTQAEWEYSTGQYKNGLRRDDTGSQGGDGEIVYKFDATNASAIELRLTHRSCNGAPVTVLYSLDGDTYTELIVLTEDHKDVNRPVSLLLDRNMLGDSNELYVKLHLESEGFYIDWNVLDTLTVLSHKGEVKVYYQITGAGNEGGSVTVPTRVEQGDSITAKAKVNEGYTFWGWFNKATGEQLGTDTTLTITPESDLDLVARFQPIYNGDGELVLYTDFNDHLMTYLSQLDDYENITTGVDDGLNVSGKYGLHIQRADGNMEAHFVYHFENMTDLTTFKAIPKGRAINGITITFHYSADGEEWEEVKVLGGSNEAMAFGYNSEKQANFTDFIGDATDFYVRVTMSIGGLGDWATLRSLTFVKNGEVLPNDSDYVELPEGEVGNIANKTEDGYIQEGTLLDIGFTKDNWVNTVWSVENGMCGADGVMVASVSDSGEIVWKFDSLKPLESMTLNLSGRAIMGSGILIRYRTNLDDEETWRGAGLLDEEEGINFNTGVDAELKLNKVKGATTVYVKALFMTTDSPNRAYISDMKVTAVASDEIPESSEPESSKPESSEPEASEPEASEPEASEPEASEPENESNPGTGVALPLLALVLAGGSAAALTVFRKKRHN